MRLDNVRQILGLFRNALVTADADNMRGTYLDDDRTLSFMTTGTAGELVDYTVHVSRNDALDTTAHTINKLASLIRTIDPAKELGSLELATYLVASGVVAP